MLSSERSHDETAAVLCPYCRLPVVVTETQFGVEFRCPMCERSFYFSEDDGGIDRF
ncbi:MAG: hypothetical protein RBS34_00550 [Desulfofustis sp.]|jgi:hypothetical protein|nr:hypothetical protein [Desulfofustis sp.]